MKIERLLHGVFMATLMLVMLPGSAWGQEIDEVETSTQSTDTADKEAKQSEDQTKASPGEELNQSKGDTDPDPLSVQQEFQRAMKLLREGQFTRASVLFERVGEQTQMVERRESALALSRYAQRLHASTKDDPVAMTALSSGRVEFIVTSTLIGAYSGIVLLDVADVEDVRLGVAMVLLTTGGALTGSLFGTRGAGIRAAEGSAYSSGSIWGATTGLLTALSFDDLDSEPIQLSVLTGIGAGAVGGYFLARETDATVGQVGVVSNGGSLGFSTAVLSLFFLEDLNFNRPLYLLAGLQAGTGAGVWMAHGSDWSGSRASFVLLGGGVGALTLWGTTALITGNDLISDDMLLAQLWAGSAIAGLWAGYGLTAWLTNGMDVDPEFEQGLSSLQLAPWITPEAHGFGVMGTF